MNNDRNKQDPRDRDVTKTMQRHPTERGEIDTPEIDDDAMIDEAERNRSDLGAGE